MSTWVWYNDRDPARSFAALTKKKLTKKLHEQCADLKETVAIFFVLS